MAKRKGRKRGRVQKRKSKKTVRRARRSSPQKSKTEDVKEEKFTYQGTFTPTDKVV